jgi:NAD(P)-dependent dehydrogenase (short-subunit alcohol dehydrogenase family)
VRNVFAEVSAKFGSLNVLVNCAGVAIGGKLYDVEKKQIISTEIAEKLMNVCAK